MSAVHTEHRGGARGYVPDDSPDIFYPGVTSTIDVIPKDFLRWWYAGMAADIALDSADILAQMATRDRAGTRKYLAGAADRYTKERAKVGSKAHDAFERMIKGETLGRVDSDIAKHVEHFADFLTVVRPQLNAAELIAWDDEHKYAGSFDADITIGIDPDTRTIDPYGDHARVLADWKTGKDIHADVALQLAAYRYAGTLINTEGVRSPMPLYGGAVVLHVTEQGWTLRSVRATEDVWEVFLACRGFFDAVRRWQGSGSQSLDRTVLGKALAGSDRIVTGTERRAK